MNKKRAEIPPSFCYRQWRLFGAGLTFNHFGVENGLQWDTNFGVSWVVAHNPDAVVGISLF